MQDAHAALVRLGAPAGKARALELGERLDEALLDAVAGPVDDGFIGLREGRNEREDEREPGKRTERFHFQSF